MSFDIADRRKRRILMFFLILVTIIVRFQNNHQTDFDSYWLHGQAESIQIHESALWVFHPMSLFGYYPLSYPSGVMFFLAGFSTLTGLDMNLTIFVTSIAVGLLTVLLTFILARLLFNSWMLSFLAGLIVSLSPIIIDYTSYNAGGRVLIFIFCLSFIQLLLNYEAKKRVIYLACAFISLIFAFLTHRTAQFMLVIVIAYVLAKAYMLLPMLWSYVSKKNWFRNTVMQRYEKNSFYLIVDLAILASIVAMAKAVDLIMRGRLDDNIEKRIIEPGTKLLLAINKQWVIFSIVVGSLVFVAAVVIFYFRFVRQIPIEGNIIKWVKNRYYDIFRNPERYLNYLIFVVFLYIFVRQFFGASFYSPSLTEYHETELLHGNQPYVIFANFIINYTTSVTPLFILFFAGMAYLIFKEDKGFREWFVVFIILGLSGMMLDKRYMRVFIIPILACIIGYGILRMFYSIAKIAGENRRYSSFLHFTFSYVIALIIFAGIFVPLVRSSTFGEQTAFKTIGSNWEAGQYIRSLDCQCSTVTTDELAAAVIIFASSGIPGASFNIYYYIDESFLHPEPLSWEKIKNTIRAGKKLQNLWYLPDWIFGGQYYIGRHARYLFANPFYDKTNQLLIQQYKEKYYIQDKQLKPDDFFQSIKPVKNSVYENPRVSIHDIITGRE